MPQPKRGPKRKTVESATVVSIKTDWEPPTYLSGEAIVAWRHVVGMLRSRGLLGKTDPSLVECYAMNVSLIRKAYATIEKEGCICENRFGVPTSHPASNLINTTSMRIKAIVNDLGLCPSSSQYATSAVTVSTVEKDAATEEREWGESLASRDNPGALAVRFINKLSHTGDYYGVPFRLRPWQEGPIRQLFGTIRADGIRQYRKTFWALPRKQGKTELVAASALYLLLGQGRMNRRVYTASGDIKQAGLIFDAARDMIGQVPYLANRTVLYEGNDKKILYPEGNSKLEVLSSVPKSKHGLGPTDVLIDEVHVVDERLISVLTTGFGARRDPLTWMITTAGWDQTSFCFDEWQYALKVKNGEIEDPTYLPVIYGAEAKDDWTDEAVWRKAMPALGDFCNIEFIREECEKAKGRPRFENEFRQLYLNQWTEQAVRWLESRRWADCETFDPAEMAGIECYAGLDLGVTGDMSALSRVFLDDDGNVSITAKFWAPRDGKWRRESRNKDVYKHWEKAGFLTFTEGESADFDQIEAEILKFNEQTPFRVLTADRAYATMMLSRLFNNYGLNVKGIPQGPITLNEPMVRFESMLLDGTLRHDGNPVLAWNIANASVKTQSTGLMHLDKSSTTQRIDGLAAAINAIAGMIADPNAGGSSESVVANLWGTL